jgi:DNA polymerase (family X)
MLEKTNREIAEHLLLIAQLKNLDGDNRFSCKAFEDASKNVLLAEEGFDLATLPGVGSKIAEVIQEFLVGNSSSILDALIAKGWDVEMMTMTAVDGIGPKRALKLYEKGYKNFTELHAAALAGELDAKLATSVVLANYKKSGRLPLHSAEQIGAYFKEDFVQAPNVLDVEVGGSIRRKTGTVKDIDLLACVPTEKDRLPLIEIFKSYAPSSFQGQDIKASIQFPFSSSQVIQVDLWIATPDYWGGLLNHATGSKDFNIAMRSLAKSKGMQVSEYGIFDEAGKKLGGEKETDLFEILDVPFVLPEDRTGTLPEGRYNGPPSLL